MNHEGLGSERWLWRELERWTRRAVSLIPVRFGRRFGKFSVNAYARVVRSRGQKEWKAWGEGYTTLPIFVSSITYAMKRALRECCEDPECTSIQATALFRVWQSKLRPYVLDAIDERIKYLESTAKPTLRVASMGFLRNVNHELKETQRAARRLVEKLESLSAQEDAPEGESDEDEGESEEPV